jgi:hypothetical protein
MREIKWRDVGNELDGDWVEHTGPKTDDQPVFLLQVDEPFSFITSKGGMEYAAGDYVALHGTEETGFTIWPVEAAELATSDGRLLAAHRWFVTQ